MLTFLFLHRWIGYAFGLIVSLFVAVFFGNCSAGEFAWRYFFLDVIFGSIMAYSIGLLIEAICLRSYLKGLKSK
jgi:hypothetical protein